MSRCRSLQSKLLSKETAFAKCGCRAQCENDSLYRTVYGRMSRLACLSWGRARCTAERPGWPVCLWAGHGAQQNVQAGLSVLCLGTVHSRLSWLACLSWGWARCTAERPGWPVRLGAETFCRLFLSSACCIRVSSFEDRPLCTFCLKARLLHASASQGSGLQVTLADVLEALV